MVEYTSSARSSARATDRYGGKKTMAAGREEGREGEE